MERVLGYYSKSLSSAQRNYCTNKKELLAIVATFDHWDVYLSYMSEPFMLCTDHAALTWLKTMACRDKAMLHWCDAVNQCPDWEKTQDTDPDIKHHRGEKSVIIGTRWKLFVMLSHV